MSYLDQLFGLNGRVALVTGATRGIGADMALALARAGADIVSLQRDLSKTGTADAIKALGRRCWIVECDLSNKSQVKGIVKKVMEQHLAPENRTIDILVNCGGIQRRTPAENFPDSDWEEVLQVNLDVVFTLCRDVGKVMLEARRSSNPPAHKGKIINVASLVSYQGGITVPAYAAAKHGVLGLIKAFSNEWAPKITVNGIAPGYIATDMNEALIANETRARQILERIPAQRWGKPEDFIGATVFLASSASDYVSGETLVVDGGWMGR